MNLCLDGDLTCQLMLCWAFQRRMWLTGQWTSGSDNIRSILRLRMTWQSNSFVWGPTKYQVIRCLDDVGRVHTIRPQHGEGPELNIHRTEIRVATGEPAPETSTTELEETRTEPGREIRPQEEDEEEHLMVAVSARQQQSSLPDSPFGVDAHTPSLPSIISTEGSRSPEPPAVPTPVSLCDSPGSPSMNINAPLESPTLSGGPLMPEDFSPVPSSVLHTESPDSLVPVSSEPPELQNVAAMSPPEARIRRTTRETAGQHSNLHHLPRPALSQGLGEH